MRGEGEITFRELLRALEAQRGYDHIAGLSYRGADGFRHNPARGVSGLEDGEIRPPRRDVRVLGGYTRGEVAVRRRCTVNRWYLMRLGLRLRNSFPSLIAQTGRQWRRAV